MLKQRKMSETMVLSTELFLLLSAKFCFALDKVHTAHFFGCACLKRKCPTPICTTMIIGSGIVGNISFGREKICGTIKHWLKPLLKHNWYIPCFFFAVKTSIFSEQQPHICVLGLSNLVKGSTEHLAGTEGNYSITIFIYKKATA